MKYTQIEAFLAIVKNGSLNKAAEQLYISQPSLTYRLNSLEDELGHPLFVRKRGQHVTSLTPEGRCFVPIAEQWKNAWSETENFRTNALLSEMRIAGVDSLNAYAFAPFYRSLGAIANHLSIQTHYSYELYNLLTNGDIDVGFVLQQFQVPDVNVMPVFSERMHLVFGGKVPFDESTVHPHDLDPSREVYLDWGNEFRNWHEFWFGKQQHPYAKIDTISLMEQFLLPGCWAVVPASVFMAFRQKMSFYSVELKDGPPDRICYMIINRRNPMEKYSWSSGFLIALNAFLQDTEWLTPLIEINSLGAFDPDNK